jgi:hypothetical protein
VFAGIMNRLNPWENSLGVFLTLVPQFAVPLTMACALFQEQHALTSVHRHSLWGISSRFLISCLHFSAHELLLLMLGKHNVVGLGDDNFLSL